MAWHEYAKSHVPGLRAEREPGTAFVTFISLLSLLHSLDYRPFNTAMGNSTSSTSSFRAHHEDTVDFGYLTPQGVYSGNRDWKEDVVTQLIIDRKIAPFYRPLEEYDSTWDEDQVLAARKEPPANTDHDGSGLRSDAPPPSSKSTHHKRSSISKELPRSVEAAIYKDATECPICFLVRYLPG